MTGIPCFKCGKKLEPAFDAAHSAPAEGVTFRCHGNYGSVVYDAQFDEYLLILICDSCLLENKASILECFPSHAPSPPDARRRWEPSRAREEEHERDQADL